MENLTYDYTVDNVAVIDKDGFTDVIDIIYYTVTATHTDGRSASISDSFKINTDNLGYIPYNETTELTNDVVKSWLVRDIKHTYQETENKNELIRLIRSQSIPGSKVIAI
jgi:hypothetical protein